MSDKGRQMFGLYFYSFDVFNYKVKNSHLYASTSLYTAMLDSSELFLFFTASKPRVNREVVPEYLRGKLTIFVYLKKKERERRENKRK
jgi:hypothetical protein